LYAQLYQYLLQHQQVHVPGIGTFLLERVPARSDFPNKMLYPPTYTVVLQADEKTPSRRFFQWLGSMLNIADRDAILRFNDFVFGLKNQIADGATIQWNGVGTLSKGLGGDIKFIPFIPETGQQPVSAEKVIRENAEHTVRVGEDERTSVQMIEMLNKTEKKRSPWWTWALIIAFLATIFIGWYFSEHGLEVSSISNRMKLSPLNGSPSYNTIP
jgi:hypothetical protein